jgi:hypothetical protein
MGDSKDSQKKAKVASDENQLLLPPRDSDDDGRVDTKTGDQGVQQ